MKIYAYRTIMFFYNRTTEYNTIKSAIYYSKEKKMNKNVQFYVLVIVSVCFFSKPISSMAEATEACGLAKEDQGKFSNGYFRNMLQRGWGPLRKVGGN